MDQERLRDNLGMGAGIALFCEESVDSTNLRAKAWARGGGRLPAVFTAEQQSMGRGRLGRSFESQRGGLYLSLALACPALEAGSLTTLAAVSALRAADILGIPQLQVKWVNDLMQDGKKVGGILAEGIAFENGLIAQVVIGIGINTGRVRFAPGLAEKAAALDWGGVKPDREKLAALIVGGILSGLAGIPGHLPFYRSRCLTLGREVCFAQNEKTMTGRAVGIRDDGSLIIKTPTGEIILSTGEAGVRSPDGGYL